MSRSANKPEDVWRYVEKRGADECWPWQSARGRGGYGVFRMRGDNYYAHRLVFWLANSGQIELKRGLLTPASQLVRHTCDNAWCCNPSHLELGSPQQNMDDKVRRGRSPDLRGERGGGAKLLNEDVVRIREAHLFGAKQKDMSAVYGVSRSAVCLIVNRISFANAGSA